MFFILPAMKNELFSLPFMDFSNTHLSFRQYLYRFGSKLYRQNVGIPIGTNCAPLVADMFLICYERDFIKSLIKEKQYDMIDAFNSTSIDNIYFEQMAHSIYPAELQLNKANSSDTEAAFLDLNLSIQNDMVATKIYDKRDDFDFDIVNFPFLDGDVPRRPSYGLYVSQSIRFARASSHVHGRLSPSAQHRVVYRKMCMRFPVVLQEIENRGSRR